MREASFKDPLVREMETPYPLAGTLHFYKVWLTRLKLLLAREELSLTECYRLKRGEIREGISSKLWPERPSARAPKLPAQPTQKSALHMPRDANVRI
jgi:hypothetical protein